MFLGAVAPLLVARFRFILFYSYQNTNLLRKLNTPTDVVLNIVDPVSDRKSDIS